MATGIGYKSIMGVGKQSSYRTAVDATDRALMVSEGIEFDYQQVLHEYLHGGAGVVDSQRVSEPVSGTVEYVVNYSEKSSSSFVSSSLPIALGFGASAWDSTNNRNKITFADNLSVNGTFAWDKGQGSDPHEAVGCYVNAMTLACNAGEAMTLSTELKAYDLKMSSTSNTVAELEALPSDQPKLCLFSDLVFQVNQQGGALSSSDNVGISGFTLSLNNTLTDYEQSSPDNSSSHTDAKKTIQPVRNGFREVTFEFTMPRYESDYFFDRLTADNNLQAVLAFDQPSSTNDFKIIIPNMKVESVSASVGGAGVIGQTVSCRCLKKNSASDVAFTDASTDSGEVWIETADERTASII